MEKGAGKKLTKKDNDILDDLLGGLSSDDSPRRKNTSLAPARRAAPGRPAKLGGKDDNFYSTLSAMAESNDLSDVSEAELDKVARSIGGLDDMDADLFGGTLSKKTSNGRPSGKPTTPRLATSNSKGNKSPTRVQSPTRGEMPTSPTGRPNLMRKPVKPPSPSTSQTNATSLPQTQPEHKPGTAPGKMSDLSLASESLVPGQKVVQRPETAPKLKKKYDFGDFDPDDPLAGLSSDEFDDLLDSDRPKSATKKPAAPILKTADATTKPAEKVAPAESPRRRNLMDRPPTRSGASGGDIGAGGDVTSDADKTAPAKSQPGIFSDSDNDLLDGLEDKGAKQPVKGNAGNSEELRPARSVLDSLLGKSNSVASSLLETKEKKPFVLDSKYSSSATGAPANKDEEDDFNFGNYQPSAASGSRPNSRRSVRFQDDDDIFGIDTRPSPRVKSPGAKTKTPADMDWLELATNTGVSTSTSPTASLVTPAAPTPAPAAVTPSTAAKPPPANKLPESPQKSQPKDITPAKPAASTTQSAKDWLGLGDSESDEELFKPKKSSVHSASLPHSPALSAQASPRIYPKKPKKDSPSPKTSTVVKEDEDQDDWLARARSRRQQMLAKEQSKDPDSLLAPANNESLDLQASRVPQSGLSADVSNIIAAEPLETSSGHLMFPPTKSSGIGLSWESPRTALSLTVSGSQSDGKNSVTPNMSSDPRLKFSSATFKQEQLPNEAVISSSSRPLPSEQLSQFQPQLFQQQQQQQQQFLLQQQLFQQQQLQKQQEQQQLQHYSQLAEEKKNQLLQQQQELQRQLSSVQLQYDSVSKAQPPSSTLIPSYAQITASIDMPDSLPAAQAKIKKLELEKSYTESLLDSLRRWYNDEMLAVENSYKNRLQIIEESNRKKESRLREENEELMQQNLARVRQLEQEKSDTITAHYRKLEDMERERTQDLERLKEQHRLSTLALKREHEEALERLARAKNEEINLVANANDTSRSLTAVVEQIQNNARDLGELQLKLDTWNRQGLDEREINLRSKDEQLRILQERLTRQESDNERERKKLEELIARMESQLREQTRIMDEERWKLKQDQSRVEAQQRSLEDERRLWQEQQARERATVERARESFLEEQRYSLQQIGEERRMLAEERTRFNIEQKTIREKINQDQIKRSQAEAEYEILSRTTAEEKLARSNRMSELQREEERIANERNKLEREKAQLELEQEKLAKQARQIREQSEQIDHVTEAARRAQQEGEQAMEEAIGYNTQMERRENEIQKQLGNLKLMEEHITQEKLRLAREKKEIENLKTSSLCVNCRSPLHASVPVTHHNGFYTPQPVPASPVQLLLSSSAHQLGANPQLVPNPLSHIADSIANDRAVRMLKIQAIKDKEYLEEENFYLESLRHMPYHSTTSKS